MDDYGGSSVYVNAFVGAKDISEIVALSNLITIVYTNSLLYENVLSQNNDLS